MSWFLTGVFYLVKEECRTIMLHGDMTLYRIIVYAQSIEESKLGRRSRDSKRGRPMSKVNLSLRRRIQIKMFLVFLMLTIRGVVVSKLISLLSQVMRRNTFQKV